MSQLPDYGGGTAGSTSMPASGSEHVCSATSSLSDSPFLPKTHRILERRFMEFRPFGKDLDGQTISDMSGVSIRSNVEYLEESIARIHGPEAGNRVVEELVRLLNERIPDPAYHVTSKFLKNPWTCYSNEFTAYLVEFCIDLSGDNDFQFNMGREKLIPSLMQTLMRPFSVSTIYKTAARWGSHYAKTSYLLEGLEVARGYAVLRMTLTDRTLRQFGPYRRSCARIWCNALKVGISIVPEKVHHFGIATVKDRLCIVEGDRCCEWEIRWPEPEPSYPGKRFATRLARHILQTEISGREKVIDEQMRSLEIRHKELQNAYVEVQQSAVELQRRVEHLTTLHEAGLTFTTTRDREALLQQALEILIHKLHYDRVMIAFYDPLRQVVHGARLLGVPLEIAAFARQMEIPITDPSTIEGTVLLQGQPILVDDLSEVGGRLHPLHRELAARTGSDSFLSVPLKVKDQILGALTINRIQKHALTEDDLALMVTFASQLTIALDNADAYSQVEALNIGLEAKVRERTAELQRVNRELKTANDQLQELDRLKSEFFANISHELRTPLTLSLGAFKSVLKLSPTTKAKELLHTGLRNTSRLLFLINEFLDLAKFDSGLMELRKQCLDFAALVRAVAANFESAVRRRIHLQGMDAPVPVEADPRQMKKVLYNLLSNAFKFTDPDKGQVWIRLSSWEGWVELEVEDNGIGIPSDQLGCIFNRFTQLEDSATRRYEGTGIGLALVKEIVTAHEGKVTAKSELGRGSTFTMLLPRGAVSLDITITIEEDESLILPVSEERHPSLVVSSPAASGDRPFVLVADDNADMRAYLERLLNRQYRIVLAKDGVEGLEQAKTFHPDLIITDVMMPRMSGYDLLKAVRGDNTIRSIPVIILTARAGTEAHVESLEAGADDYIAKPFDENEILARVNNLIRSRAQERELIKLREEKLTRFLPAQLAEMILAGRADEVLRSHRAEVTVVFIDLRGFTPFAEITEPENLMEVLREYQSEMGRLISDHHGVIERFSGDAMMIFFNDPVPVPNHAEQAVRMAIAMRNRIEQMKQEWSQRGIHLGAGIGVATGHATLGLIGFERRQDYAAIGAVTNLAARLCGEAQHGQILISERVMHLTKDIVCTEPVGNLTLKGFHKPVLAYNVTGLPKQRSL